MEEYLYAYLEAAGIQDEKASPLFRSTIGKTKKLSDRPLYQQNVYDMIRRRAAAVAIKTKLGCHSMRGTGITNFLENGGTIEAAASRHLTYPSDKTTGLFRPLRL